MHVPSARGLLALGAGLTLCVSSFAPPASAVPLGEKVDGQALPGANLNVFNDFYFKFNTFSDEAPDDALPAPL